MAPIRSADHQTQGAVILARLATTSIPASLKPSVQAFKASQASLVAASTAADAARGARDDALSAVGAADATLDKAVLALADTMVGASLGTRKNPFAGYAKEAPAAMTGLAYADEVKAVLALAVKVKKAKPPADVAKGVATCVKLASGVTAALGQLSKPQLAYTKALAARDALLPAWTKALQKLKKYAAAAWFDDSATYKAVFAPPERVQAPVHARPKKPAPAAPAPTPPVTLTPAIKV